MGPEKAHREATRERTKVAEKELSEWRKLCGPTPQQARADAMFPSRQPGKLMHNTAPRKAILDCLVRAKAYRRFTVHGFRHTFNNEVRKVAETHGGGVVVRALTGHSSDEMTDRYSWVAVEEKRDVVSGYLRLVRTG